MKYKGEARFPKDAKLIMAMFCCWCCIPASARPQAHDHSALVDANRQFDNSSSTASPSYESIEYTKQTFDADVTADFNSSARASSTKIRLPSPTTAKTPLRESLKTVTKQLVTSASAVEMVATDRRTPPKVQSQLAQAHQEFESSSGKGEAIPVLLEDSSESTGNIAGSHSNTLAPIGGISTWVLLNSEMEPTPNSYPKRHQKPSMLEISNITSALENMTISDAKRKQAAKTTTLSTPIDSEKPWKVSKKPDRKTVAQATIQRLNGTLVRKTTTFATKTDNNFESSTLSSAIVTIQDAKFRNKTPTVVGRVPTTTPKDKIIEFVSMGNVTTPPPHEIFANSLTRLGTPVVTYPHVTMKPKITVTTEATNSDKKILSTTKRANINSTVAMETTTMGSVNATSTITQTTNLIISKNSTDTTTKKPSSRPKKKKKNKNKNRRKRPSGTKKTNVVQTPIQSKIADDNSTTKISEIQTTSHNTHTASGKPMTTRIYNYIAREVMPNVGVGIVGLMLTAGLAGLFGLYPFVAPVPLRRNSYEKPGGITYVNSYRPMPEVDNGQPEESVLGQVLAGMTHGMTEYSREQPDSHFEMPSKHQQHHQHDYHPNYEKPVNKFDNEIEHYEGANQRIKYNMAGISEDAELGDVVSGPHESVKFTSYDANPQPLPDTNEDGPPDFSNLHLTSEKSIVDSAVLSDQNDNRDKYSPLIGITVESRDPSDYKDIISSNAANKQDESNSFNASEPSEKPKFSLSVEPKDDDFSAAHYVSYNNPDDLIQNPSSYGEIAHYVHTAKSTEKITQISNSSPTTDKAVRVTPVKSSSYDREDIPKYAALEGMPKNYRTLSASISLDDSALPMNHEFVPIDTSKSGVSYEHGPRNMKLRRRRDVGDNEIDSVLTDTPATSSPVDSIVENVSKIIRDAIMTTASPKPIVLSNQSSEASVTKFQSLESVIVASNETTSTTNLENLSSNSTEKMDYNSSYSNNTEKTEQFSSNNTEKTKEIPHEKDSTTERPDNKFKPLIINSLEDDRFTETAKENTTTANESSGIETGSSKLDESSTTTTNPFYEEIPSQPSSSLLSIPNLFRRILDFKLRLGMELLRTTGEALSRYIDNVQKRMTETLRQYQRTNERDLRHNRIIQNITKKRE